MVLRLATQVQKLNYSKTLISNIYDFFLKKIDLDHLTVSATGPDGPPTFRTLRLYNGGRIVTVVAYHKQGCNVSMKNKIFSRSGNFEFWPFDPCQGIIREFCYDIFLDWKFHHIRHLPGLCLCKYLLGKYKLHVYWLLLLSCCLLRILGMWWDCS